MSNNTTNQEIVTNDMDNFKEYLKTSFEAGSAYTETFINQLKIDYPDLNTDIYNKIHSISTKGIGEGTK